MNQLQISDEGVAEQLVELCDQINEGIWIDECEIFEMFKEIFEKLNEKDQKAALVYIKANQQTFIYVKKLELQYNTEDVSNEIQEVIDYKKIYQQLIQQTDQQQLINHLKQKEFCVQNNINPILINNFEILYKLKEKAFDLLNLNRLSKITELGYSYREIFKILLGFIEKKNDLDESESKKLEIIIGTLLEEQVQSFLEYENNLLQTENYETINKIISAIQLEGKKYEDFLTELQSLSFDQQMFIKLCTIQTKEKALENVKKQVSQLLYCENVQWEQKIDQNILNYHGFESLYFSIIFYFWQQYCQQKYSEFNQLQINLKKLSKIEQNLRLIKSFISKVKENSQDQIYLFIIHHSIQFSCQKEEYLDKEKISIYQKFQQHNYNLSCQLFKKDIQIVLQNDQNCQLKILRFMPIFKLKNQRIQFTQQNENIKPSQGGEQNDISQDKDTTQKKKDDLIQNCSQEILNQDFDTNLTTEQQFVIQLLFQNPQREFYNEKKKDLALQFILQKSDDIEIYINELISQEQNLSYGEIVLFLELLNPKFKQLIRNIIKLYKINQSFKLFRALMCLNDYFIENYNLEGKQQEFSFEQSYSFSKELINELLLLNEEELLSLKILFGRNKFQMLFVATVNQYLISQTKTQNNYMNILQKLVPMCPGKYNVKIQTFRALFFCLRPWLLNYLLSLNIKQYITPSVFKRTLIIIFTIMVKKDEQISKFILSNLNHIFDQPCYDFDQIWKAKKRQIIDKFNFKLNLINFFISNDLYENLQEECRSLFQEDPQFYKEEVGKVNYFECIQLNSVYLLQKNIFDQCPLDGGFTLEDFNISLTVITSQQEGRIVQDWMDNLKDTVKFKALIPFFFNIIKRGESPKKLLSIITTHRSQNKETLKIIRNMKALFQLFYNNSNEELKVMLLKLYSNMYPIPLIFQNPYLQTAQEEIDLFKFNDKLYYVFKKSFTIINFSLSEKQAQIGKTELINQLFYQQEKFETQDICQLNNNTIDIMFDTQFNGSRNFSVADAHGLIPIEILVKILPLFRMWIIQFDSESELIENYNQLNLIKNNLDLQNHKVCFIIRNYKGELEENTINNEYTAILEQIKKEGIKLHKIIDLAQRGLDKYQKELELQLAQTFLFLEIDDDEQSLFVTEDNFLSIIKNFDTKEKQISHQYFIDRDIIMDLENELSRLILKPFGFYDQEAFPIRSIEYQLKHLRERQSKIMQQENALNKTESYIKINQKGVDNNQNSIEIEKIKQQLINLEDSIKNSQLSKLLMIFCKIFDQNSNYILYLQFTDQIRKFNERNTYELQEKNQLINDQLMKLKKDRDQIKLKKK